VTLALLTLVMLASVSFLRPAPAARAPAVDAMPSRHPNILFVLADDMGYADIGCFGNKEIRTPNIDRLAAEGVRMPQFYCGTPVCAPSRAAFLSGRSSIHTGVKRNGDDLSRSEVTIAEALRARGYATALVGKWHRGSNPDWSHPLEHGFDFFFGFIDAFDAHDHYPRTFWRNRVEVPNTSYSTDRFTQEALAFIRAHHDGPFFLFLPFTAPHAQIQAPADAVAEYRGRFAESDPAHPEHAAYAAMITRLDRGIGRVLDLLRTLGLERDTLVVFTSDHGAPPGVAQRFGSNGPFRGGKRNVYEGGLRIPVVVRWPAQLPAGRTDTAVGYACDLFPTFLAAAGGDPVQTKAHLDGINLLPVWRGAAPPAARTLYWEWPGKAPAQHALAVRSGDWKLIESAESVELYDLSKDPGESRNLAAEHPDRVRDLKQRLTAWLATETPRAPASVDIGVGRG
jgi:arylsulfatase A-like enzyme